MKASVKDVYYYSENEKDSILINRVVTSLEADYEPYYYIKFVTTNASKPEWKYISKELRGKEIKEIRELKKKDNHKVTGFEIL